MECETGNDKKKKTLKEVKIKFYTNFTPIPEGQGLCRRAVHGSKRSARAVAIKCLASVGNERTCSLAQWPESVPLICINGYLTLFPNCKL